MSRHGSLSNYDADGPCLVTFRKNKFWGFTAVCSQKGINKINQDTCWHLERRWYFLIMITFAVLFNRRDGLYLDSLFLHCGGSFIESLIMALYPFPTSRNIYNTIPIYIYQASKEELMSLFISLYWVEVSVTSIHESIKKPFCSSVLKVNYCDFQYIYICRYLRDVRCLLLQPDSCTVYCSWRYGMLVSIIVSTFHPKIYEVYISTHKGSFIPRVEC